jgi:hypothetical protein
MIIMIMIDEGEQLDTRVKCHWQLAISNTEIGGVICVELELGGREKKRQNVTHQ